MKIRENNRKLRYLITYSLVFVICALLCFYWYYGKGLSFVYDGDGYSQHFKAYIYYGEYLRTILNNIFVKHSFVIPQWDFSIGEGSDILGTFSYYVIGDPLTLFCVFFKPEQMYIFYNLSVIIRLYLSGLAFSYYCFYHKKDSFVILCGSIIYAFCFWNLFNSTRHIYFVNSMIYFPLVIAGVDKLLDGNKPHSFLLAVLISCISNFYFFYNIVILTVVYVIVKSLFLYKTDFRKIFSKTLIIAKYSILAVLIGSFIFLPVLNVFLSDSRMGIDFGKHLVYPLSYYKKLPSLFLSTSREYWLCMGYASPALMALLVSFLRWKDNKLQLTFNMIGLIMIMFPFFGQAMNGFSYISNKWCFALSFLISYNFMNQYEYFAKYKRTLLIFSLLLLAGSLVLRFGINMIVPVAMAVLFTLGINFTNERVSGYICLAAIIICISFNAMNQYSEYGSYYSSYAKTYESNKNIMKDSELYEFKEYMNGKDETFYRCSGVGITQNASILSGTHSTDFYWSLGNPYISDYRRDLELDEYSLFKFYGYNGRAIINTLANVKYYIVPKGYKNILPYGFEKYGSFSDRDLYINSEWLPFGYTYSDTYSLNDWLKLSAVEKENILSKAIVIENGKNNARTEIEYNDYSFENSEDVTVKDGYFVVDKNNATIRLKVDIEKDKDLYLSIKGLSYDDGKAWIKDKEEYAGVSFNISNGTTTSFLLYSNDSRYYNGRTDFNVYLGYLNEEVSYIDLTFASKGYYTFSELSVITTDRQDYKGSMDELRKETLEDVTFETNKVSGTIDVSEDKYLLLSIPYSKGWKAYVDGNKAEIFNANIAYSALKLDKGYHDVKLVYETPYLKIGFLLSLAGIILFILDRKISSKHNNEK